MKKLLTIAFALVTSSAFAQITLDFRSIGSSFELEFNKGFVCKSTPAFSKAPTLGYGQTINQAQANAINNCIAETGNHRMHCDEVVCEAIAFDTDKPTVSVSVVNNQIGVRFSTGAKQSCVAQAAFTREIYVAEAQTQIEAQVYAERLCMEQSGNARMHCDVDACTSISKEVEISDNIFDLFKGNKEKKIRKLEKEIKVLEEKIADPNVSEKTKKKLRAELSEKSEKLIELKNKN